MGPGDKSGHSQDERFKVGSQGDKLLVPACQGELHPDSALLSRAGTSRVQRESLEPPRRDIAKDEGPLNLRGPSLAGIQILPGSHSLLVHLSFVHRCDTQV